MNEEVRHPDMPQEEDDVPWRTVFLGFMATLSLAGVMIVAAWGSLRSIEAEVRPSGIFPEANLGPRRSVVEVQEDLFGRPPGFGQLLDAQKHKALSTYGWVDRARGIVRVPIDQAMDLVVEENR